MGRSNLLLIFIFVLRGASCENIWCSTGGKNSKSICNCSEVTRKPWSNSSERPAPKPYNMSLEWFVSRQISETQIGINVSWTQKGADFDSDYCVKGYYLEISGLSRDAEKYLCKLQHFKTNEIFVGFHFVNWQPTGKVQQLTYEITALPLHIRGHKPSSSIDQTLIIPECCVNKADKHIDEHSNSVPLLGTVPTMNEHPLGSFPGVTAPAGHLMDPVKVITLVSLILSGFIIVALLVCISQSCKLCDLQISMEFKVGENRTQDINSPVEPRGDWIDIKSYITAQKVKWIQYLLEENYTCNWKTLELNALRPFDLKVLLKGKLNWNSRIIQSFPLVSVRDSPINWFSYKNLVEPLTVPSEPLWYNKNLRYCRTPFFVQSWNSN